jgi:CheY-like chemotaxis protein
MPRVLLIEDDLDTGESIRAMLEVTGHEAIWALHGKEALAVASQDACFDVLLTDILMPEMDGLESIQYFRKHHPAIAIVAMTAQRDSPYLQAASLFGAKGTLQKPFSIQELDEAIRKAAASTPPAP